MTARIPDHVTSYIFSRLCDWQKTGMLSESMHSYKSSGEKVDNDNDEHVVIQGLMVAELHALLHAA